MVAVYQKEVADHLDEFQIDEDSSKGAHIEAVEVRQEKV